MLRRAWQAALQACRQSHGGTVFFPSGTWFILGGLSVPERCRIVGASRKLTALRFFEQTNATAPQAYISNEGAAWGLTDVSIYITAFFDKVVATTQSTSFFEMRRVLVRAVSYFGLGPRGGGHRNRAAPWREDSVPNGSPDPFPAAVWLGGRNLFVTDCDLWSSYNVLSTLQNGNRIQFVTIARNRIWVRFLTEILDDFRRFRRRNLAIFDGILDRMAARRTSRRRCSRLCSRATR